jgi:hypothetical protein
VFNERSRVTWGGEEEALLGYVIQMMRKTGAVKDGDFRWIDRVEDLAK